MEGGGHQDGRGAHRASRGRGGGRCWPKALAALLMACPACMFSVAVSVNAL
jgi:hypothetical protein